MVDATPSESPSQVSSKSTRMSGRSPLGLGRRGLIDLAVDRPVAVTMVVLAIAVFGYVSLEKLRVALLPRINYPSLTIRTEYPGAAPAEVEELVTRSLEERVSVIGKLIGHRSVSRAGVSDIILEFEWDADMSFAAQDVREKVDQARPFLPQDTRKPLLLKYDPTLDPILRLGLYGGPESRMRFWGDEVLKKRLESIPGVAAIKVRGGFEEEIRVDLDELKLRQYRISVGLIQQRLQEENVNLASGVIREGDTEYLVRTLNQFRSVEEIADLVMAVRDRATIRLADVATVHAAHKERDVITRINGQPSVEVHVFKEDSSNIVDVAHSVKAALFGTDWARRLVGGEISGKSKTKKSSGGGSGGRGRGDGGGSSIGGERRPVAEALPPGMRLRLLSDQSRFIEKAVDEVRETGVYGALFAVLVLFVFLGAWKSTLIIALSIPISVIATFGPMMQFGVTLNIMSLGGLALGIGMLVDASIVVLESIDRCRREGDGVRRAAVRGTKEVAGAVTASVITTVAVFLPIVFVSGIAGEIFKDQALTVVFSLLTSLAVALFFIPALAGRPFMAERGNDRIIPSIPWRRVFPPFKSWNAVESLTAASAWRSRGGRTARGLKTVFLVPAVLLMFVQLAFESVGRLVLAVLMAATLVVRLILGTLLWPIAKAWKLFGVAFDGAFRAIESVYRMLLSGALRVRLLIVAAAAVMLFFSWRLTDDIGLELIPRVRSGEIVLDAPLEVGASLETTSAVARNIESRIDSARKAGDIDILGYSSTIGIARDEVAPAGEGPHTQKILIVVPQDQNMATREEAVIDTVRADIATLAEVGKPKFTSPKLFSFQNPLEVQILGDNLDRTDEVARRLERAMDEIDGLVDVRSSVQQGSPEFVIEYDRLALSRYGISLGQAARTLRDKVKGVVPTHFSTRDNRGRKIDVLVKIPEEAITTVDALKDIEVSSNEGTVVRLADVADIRQGRGPSEIRHISGGRAAVITADTQGIDLDAASSAIQDAVTKIRRDAPDLFDGVIVRIGGQAEEAEKSSQELMFALVLALVLVYIVMASQFESLLDPLVIMITSVFAGVGVIAALWLLRMPISVVVLIGAIMLAGIVVNNAIVLVDAAGRLYRRGMPRRDAVIEAGRLRLRPILMTTTTTVLGLLPMALSTGEGSELRVPMAITVIAGLVSGTLLTLIIIPVVYSLAHDVVEGITAPFRRSDREEAA